jgi:DNA primase
VKAVRAIDLAEVIQAEGVTLRHDRGHCPFHDDQTPSFSVYQGRDGRQRWHCFGCGAGGDVVDFVQKLHRVDFPGALRLLGIAPGPMSPASKRQIQKRHRAQRIVESFEEWIDAAADELETLIRCTMKVASSWKTVEEFQAGAEILRLLAVWDYYLTILLQGSHVEGLTY